MSPEQATATLTNNGPHSTFTRTSRVVCTKLLTGEITVCGGERPRTIRRIVSLDAARRFRQLRPRSPRRTFQCGVPACFGSNRSSVWEKRGRVAFRFETGCLDGRPPLARPGRSIGPGVALVQVGTDWSRRCVDGDDLGLPSGVVELRRCRFRPGDNGRPERAQSVALREATSWSPQSNANERGIAKREAEPTTEPQRGTTKRVPSGTPGIDSSIKTVQEWRRTSLPQRRDRWRSCVSNRSLMVRYANCSTCNSATGDIPTCGRSSVVVRQRRCGRVNPKIGEYHAVPVPTSCLQNSLRSNQ